MRILRGRLAPRRLDFGEEAPLVDHLTELRHRVIFSLVTLVAAFAVTYAFRHHVIHWLETPLPDDQEGKLVTLSPAEPFITSLMVSLYAAGVIALPMIIYQVWAFFAPALSPTNQRKIVGLTLFATLLAGAGLVFGYFIALPAAVKFLTSYDNELYQTQIRARDYFSFASTVMIAVAVVFELPIVILGLVMVRVLSYKKLKKNRRLGYVLMAALAVALPGIDPVTTVLEMIPLMVLFEGSIWMAWWIERKRRQKAAAEGEEYDGDDDGGGSAVAAWAPDPEPEPDPEPFEAAPSWRRDPRDRDDL